MKKDGAPRARRPSRSRRYWLFKTEPSELSIEGLRRSPGGVARWDGVRSYQARNFLRDQVQRDDGVLIYHSSIQTPAIVGLARIARTAYPDPTAFDLSSDYFDSKSVRDRPRWIAVDVAWVRTFATSQPLKELRARPELARMMLLRRGMRLSIQPVAVEHWRAILRAAGLRDDPW